MTTPEEHEHEVIRFVRAASEAVLLGTIETWGIIGTDNGMAFTITKDGQHCSFKAECPCGAADILELAIIELTKRLETLANKDKVLQFTTPVRRQKQKPPRRLQ